MSDTQTVEIGDVVTILTTDGNDDPNQYTVIKVDGPVMALKNNTTSRISKAHISRLKSKVGMNDGDGMDEADADDNQEKNIVSTKKADTTVTSKKVVSLTKPAPKPVKPKVEEKPAEAEANEDEDEVKAKETQVAKAETQEAETKDEESDTEDEEEEDEAESTEEKTEETEADTAEMSSEDAEEETSEEDESEDSDDSESDENGDKPKAKKPSKPAKKTVAKKPAAKKEPAPKATPYDFKPLIAAGNEVWTKTCEGFNSKTVEVKSHVIIAKDQKSFYTFNTYNGLLNAKGKSNSKFKPHVYPIKDSDELEKKHNKLEKDGYELVQ